MKSEFLWSIYSADQGVLNSYHLITHILCRSGGSEQLPFKFVRGKDNFPVTSDMKIH